MGEKDAASGADKKNDGGAKKEESGSLTVVYKIDMHCDGCAKKISKSVKKFQGVESVHGDSSTNKLTVKGKVDPSKLRENIEYKTKKKVELISPQPAKKEEKKKDPKKDTEKKPQETKPGSDEKKKEVSPSTVVFKIRLHCDGCIQKIGKTVKKFKGVQGVEIETGKDLVMVKGTMDVKELQHYLKERFRRGVEIVPPKKEGEAKKADGDGDKKGKDGEGDKKGKDGDGDGGEKKKEEGEKKKEGGGEKQEVKKIEHYYAYENGYGYGYGNGYGSGSGPGYSHDHGYGYGNGYPPAQVNAYYGNENGPANGYYGNAPAPQIFSDENPNACSVM